MDKGKDSRGVYRAIYTNIWDDPDFRCLPSEAKLVFLNLRTSPLSNMPCIFPFYIEAIEKQTGLPRKVIEEALDILGRNRWIVIQDGIVWVRNGLKFDPNISLKNENQVKAINKILLGLPKSQLVEEFCRYYGLEIPYKIANRKGMAYPMPIQKPEPEPEPDPEPDPDPEPKTERDGVSSELCSRLINLYNTSCPSLPKAKKLTESRRTKIIAALKEFPDFEWWKEVFRRANHVSIEDDNLWIPSLDWLIKDPTNALKIAEGAYGSE